ncbi:hypothetical protein CS542_09295 [Pedobacter sp. IW39]|nr:hypothetical protein CS542_09295 [Pedobacter sp. IW39]
MYDQIIRTKQLWAQKYKIAKVAFPHKKNLYPVVLFQLIQFCFLDLPCLLHGLYLCHYPVVNNQILLIKRSLLI